MPFGKDFIERVEKFGMYILPYLGYNTSLIAAHGWQKHLSRKLSKDVSIQQQQILLVPLITKINFTNLFVISQTVPTRCGTYTKPITVHLYMPKNLKNDFTVTDQEILSQCTWAEMCSSGSRTTFEDR